MKRKKLGALLLAAGMLVGSLTGCGDVSGAASAEKSGTENTAPADDESGSEEVTELTFFNNDGTEDLWDDPVAQAITEATGVKLKVSYPISSDDGTVDLMIAEQNYPDIIYGKDKGGTLIQAGALIDMTDLIEEYGPNIKKLYGDELAKLKYSQEDPSIYQLSSYAVGGTTFTSCGDAQIQFDVLKANDYDWPGTVDEFEKMIKDYMAANPKTEDGLDRIGITLSTADWHWMITLGNPAGFIADGAPDNGQWLVDDDYNAVYKVRSDNEREYFRWLNRMYHEGVLDPEFATQTHEDYIAKIASGRVVALLDQDWDYADAEKVLKADGKYGATYCGLPLVMDDSLKCHSLMYQGLTTGWGVGITTSCKDPVKAIKFIDFMCSDEGQILNNWGIQDVNYFVDEDGKRYRTAEEVEMANSDPDYSKKTGVGKRKYPFPVYGDGVQDSTGNYYTTVNKETVIQDYNDEQRAACEAWGTELLVDIFPQASEFEIPPYSAIWAYNTPTEFGEITTRLSEICWPGLISCVIGDAESFDANYDKMLADMETAGMSEAENMLTEILAEKIALMEE